MIVFALSRCLEKAKVCEYWEFHFKGYFEGERINKLFLRGDRDRFEASTDYILKIKIESIHKSVLRGFVLSYRKLDDIKV